ncbi:MAG: hypothetical protein FWG20_04860 [Candidatus Cloacimonetes bacterium]|nr:hypothetical protein [Candidatus Cloacimonadota bacterium]
MNHSFIASNLDIILSVWQFSLVDDNEGIVLPIDRKYFFDILLLLLIIK